MGLRHGECICINITVSIFFFLCHFSVVQLFFFLNKSLIPLIKRSVQTSVLQCAANTHKRREPTCGEKTVNI